MKEVVGGFLHGKKKGHRHFLTLVFSVSKVVTVKRSVVTDKKGAIGCLHFDRLEIQGDVFKRWVVTGLTKLETWFSSFQHKYHELVLEKK